MAVEQPDSTMFLTQVENLTRTHREHELYYSQAPLEDAVTLQQFSRVLKALAILEVVNFMPAALRADLADKRLAPRYLYSAAELIDAAADLLAEGAVLVHDSERRWRVFHGRVEAIAGRRSE